MSGTGTGWKQMHCKVNFKDEINFAESPIFEKGTAGVGIYNVLTYGADPTGVADSTTAIQACIDAAKDGTVLIPSGLYLVSTIDITHSTTINGQGNSLTSNYNATQIKSVTGAAIFNIYPTGASGLGATLNNMLIYGDGSANQIGILINGESPVLINRVTITGCGDWGIKCCTIDHTTSITILDCTINSNYGGIFGVGQPTRQFNAIKILNNSLSGNTGYGVHVSGVNINIKGNLFQSNDLGGILLSGGVLGDVSGGSSGIIITENYFESNKGGMLTIEGYHSPDNGNIYQSQNRVIFTNNHGTHNLASVDSTTSLIKFRMSEGSLNDYFPFDGLFLSTGDISTIENDIYIVDFGSLCDDKCRVELSSFPYQNGLIFPSFTGIDVPGHTPSFFGFYDAPSNWIGSNLIAVYSQISIYDLHRWVKTNLNAPLTLAANPQIATGLEGQLITIIGNSDTNILTLSDGNGLHLPGGVSVILGKNDSITLRYSIEDSIWYKIS
jgi:hypothetical protein